MKTTTLLEFKGTNVVDHGEGEFALDPNQSPTHLDAWKTNERGRPAERSPQKPDPHEAYLERKNTRRLSVRPSDHHFADDHFAMNVRWRLAVARG